MKVISNQKYGNPEVLNMTEKAVPKPGPTEVLVEVYAASLNPAEWHYMRATIFMLRLVNGFFKPRNPYLRADIAGVVVQVGSKVTQFKVGDEVYGRNQIGGYAEFACIEEKNTCLKPGNLNFKQSAAIPLAALTALQGLRAGNISAHDSVLINGASGGIGTLAIQLAKYFNARVTGVCSTDNIEFVKALGADSVIDYTQASLPPIQHNLILDLVGNLSGNDIKRALKPGGICVIIGFESMRKMLSALLKHNKKVNPNKRNYKIINAETKQEDLQFIKQLVEENNIRPVIDKTYPFEQMQIRKAFSYLGTKRAKGKIVIEIKADYNQ